MLWKSGCWQIPMLLLEHLSTLPAPNPVKPVAPHFRFPGHLSFHELELSPSTGTSFNDELTPHQPEAWPIRLSHTFDSVSNGPRSKVKHWVSSVRLLCEFASKVPRRQDWSWSVRGHFQWFMGRSAPHILKPPEFITTRACKRPVSSDKICLSRPSWT